MKEEIIAREERPVKSFLERKNPTSFLKARKSKTICSIDTTYVRTSTQSFCLEKNNRRSSKSCSVISPILTFWANCCAIMCTPRNINRERGLKEISSSVVELCVTFVKYRR